MGKRLTGSSNYLQKSFKNFFEVLENYKKFGKKLGFLIHHQKFKNPSLFSKNFEFSKTWKKFLIFFCKCLEDTVRRFPTKFHYFLLCLWHVIFFHQVENSHLKFLPKMTKLRKIEILRTQTDILDVRKAAYRNGLLT